MTAPEHVQDRRLNPLLAAVLTAVTDRRYTPNEWEWISPIEQRRRELAARTDVLAYVDYGAGSPDATRTAEQMAAGVPGRNTVGQLTKVASKQPKWAGLLFRLIREAQPQRCIEMGAAAGISAAYQSAALRMNGAGQLVSLEGGETIAALAADTLKSLGLDDVAEVRHGRFADTLGPALAEAPPDYVFIDGHHDGPATVAYFDQVTSVMRSGIVVLDDIEWSAGMREAWWNVALTPAVAASIDLGSIGVCIVGTGDHPLRCTIADY